MTPKKLIKIGQINYATVAKPHTPMYLLEKFFNQYGKKEKISTDDFDKLFRMPKNDSEQKQNSLGLYL